MGTDRRPTRILLVGTFLVFFLPILAAWLLNVFAPDWRPFGTLNHGTLVQPVRQLSAARLEHVDGSPLDSGYLAGRWTIVHLLDGDCRQSCMDALTRSHQVQQALGDDMQRVQLLLVVQPAVASCPRQTFHRRLPWRRPTATGWRSFPLRQPRQVTICASTWWTRKDI